MKHGPDNCVGVFYDARKNELYIHMYSYPSGYYHVLEGIDGYFCLESEDYLKLKYVGEL